MTVLLFLSLCTYHFNLPFISLSPALPSSLSFRTPWPTPQSFAKALSDATATANSTATARVLNLLSLADPIVPPTFACSAPHPTASTFVVRLPSLRPTSPKSSSNTIEVFVSESEERKRRARLPLRHAHSHPPRAMLGHVRGFGRSGQSSLDVQVDNGR
jgi:hypothetical protein